MVFCTNNDPGLNLTYFTSRSNFVGFSVGKREKRWIFQKLLQLVT